MSRTSPESRPEPSDFPESSDAGFTLMEVLVAFGILSVILGLLFVAIHQTERTITSVDSGTRFERKMEIIRYLLREELLGAYLNPNDPLTTFIGFPNREHNRDTDSLLFTTLSQTRLSQSSPVSHLEGIQYLLFKSPGTDLFTLVHEQNTNLLSYGTQAVIPEKLLGHVWSLRIRYFDGMLWTDRWNSVQSHALPLLTRFDIVVVNGKGEKRIFFEEVQIPQTTLNQNQGGGNEIPEGSGSTGN
ncbi:MAG: prepilin-type N-terminal cleavage/methylation domain-containing protein [Nitrospiraceae bacterium]|nr:prepilin-type N-terminal cleavage/methylation domain-containing protein [Nitrospiraceae bacterium]